MLQCTVKLLTLILLVGCGQRTADSVTPAPTTAANTADTDTPCGSTSLTLTAIFNCKGNEIDDSLVNSSQVAWLVLDRTKSSHRQWDGVGKYGGCTATLLDVGGSGSDPAYVITNGHCFGLLDPSQVFLDNKSMATNVMQFDYYVQQVKDGDTYSVGDETVVYASMAQTDVAVIELEATFDSLVERGYDAYQLASSAPKSGTDVTLVGIPSAKVTNVGLRKADCKTGSTVTVHEGAYRFTSSIRHRCSIVKGSSGSALINRETKRIVAVNNTGVSGAAPGTPACDLDMPCEVSSDGTKTVRTEENYAQPTHFLAGCFRSGRWDRSLSTCQAASQASESANAKPR